MDGVPSRVLDDPDSFTGRLNHMKIKVASPDRAVHAIYTIHDGYRVTFDASKLRHHTEESLAAAIKTAIGGVSRGYGKGTRAIAPERAAGRRPLPDPASEKRRHRLDTLVGEIDVVHTSPGGHVKVRLRGRSETDVKIRPGTLANVGVKPAELAAELNAALDGAFAEFARHKRAVYETEHI